jgi:Arc/MetJ family transcription regulator
MMQMRYDALMRTTIDLPDDLHQQALSIARDTSRSLSETVADLMRRGLGGSGGSVEVSTSARTGLPVVRLGTTISTEDVRALDDDQ